MRILNIRAARSLLRRLCRRRGLATLAVLLGCVPVAAAVAYAADQALLARRWAALDAERAPFGPSPEMAAKTKRALAQDSGVPAGAEAPDFTLPDASGRPVTLS